MSATELLQQKLDALPESEREAIATRFLSELETRQPGAPTSESGPRAPLPQYEPVSFERIEHLLGTVEGPSDLARSKRYLKGMGERSMR